MIRTCTIALAAVLALTGTLRADLGKAKAESNLGRRAHLALENAKVQFRAASEADKAGDWEKTTAALGEVRDSVELDYAALKETGRTPRKSGDYKNLEIETRRLSRSLGDLLLNMSPDEREQMSPIEAYVRHVHDEVLESIMDSGKGKKKR